MTTVGHRFATLRLAALVSALLFVILPAQARAQSYDNLNDQTFNPVVGGAEIPITSAGTFSATYNSSAFTLDSPGEDTRPGCNNGTRWGGRTGWIRFVPGVRGRLGVAVDSSYDVLAFAYSYHSTRETRSYSSTSLRTLDCNNGTSPGGGESGMLIRSEQMEPNTPILIQTAGACGTAPCTGTAGVGGATTVTVNFVPDDNDSDGVPDTLDECAGTAGSSATGGCPDADGDAIRDSGDRCPGAAGPASFQGCPDLDRDGLRDIDDVCPSAAGPAGLGGCPDRDGDNVRDIDDACPDTAGAATNRGCQTDPDGDGVLDPVDTCPAQAGIAPDGCPDGDGDGVASADGCPTEPGLPPTGCPTPLDATFPREFAAFSNGTVVLKLQVRAPVGARIAVRCIGRRCVLKPRRGRARTSLVMTATRRLTDLRHLLGKRKLPVGTRIQVRVTAPRTLGSFVELTIRRRALPKVTERCIRPNGSLSRCPG